MMPIYSARRLSYFSKHSNIYHTEAHKPCVNQLVAISHIWWACITQSIGRWCIGAFEAQLCRFGSMTAVNLSHWSPTIVALACRFGTLSLAALGWLLGRVGYPDITLPVVFCPALDIAPLKPSRPMRSAEALGSGCVLDPRFPDHPSWHPIR
jgi:hypothetical protein